MIARNAIKLEILDSSNGVVLYKAVQDGKMWFETHDRNKKIMVFPYLVNAMDYFCEISHGEELKTGAL